MNNRFNQQESNALFYFLNSLKNVVFWVCTPDYKQQVFVSQAFEQIFLEPVDTMYKDMSFIFSAYLPEDLKKIESEFAARNDEPGPNGMFFRIYRKDGEIRYMQDCSYTFVDRFGAPKLLAGVNELLLPEQWHEMYDKSPSLKINEVPKLYENFFSAISQEYGLLLPDSLLNKSNRLDMPPKTLIINNHSIKLTKREGQCLFHLLQGQTAKQTANKLCLSPRTVELYLDNLRLKTDCKTKLELLSAIERSDIELA